MMKWCVNGLYRFKSIDAMGVTIDMSPDDIPCAFIRGSDPLMQTARGKLQNQRSKLNEQIDRELRLRTGAENLFKASTNAKLKDTVAKELSCVNANLQLLKEELSDLNSSVHVYQNDNSVSCVPMLPLGLKETKSVDFTKFTNFITEHYHEDGSFYLPHLQRLNEIRQACRTPLREDEGIELLGQYFNQLYFVERRLFVPGKPSGLVFEWFDSLTGIPCSQSTMAYEKGGILFNMGSLYTQIAARQDRTTDEGSDRAIHNFCRAAGCFNYLHDNFSNAPSRDMRPHTLSMFVQLMLSQATECTFEKFTRSHDSEEVKDWTILSQEAAWVGEMYSKCHKMMKHAPVNDYLPPSWLSLAEVKWQYFMGLSHYFYALAMSKVSLDSDDLSQLLCVVSDRLDEDDEVNQDNKTEQEVPKSLQDKQLLVKTHLHQSVINLEQAMSVHNQSKQLRRIDTFQDKLHKAHERSLSMFSDLEEEDDFTDLKKAPVIPGKTSKKYEALIPDLTEHKVTDILHDLGPVAIFSARHEWSTPRSVTLIKDDNHPNLGFSVRGDSPVIISDVDEGGLAESAGVIFGDFITSVNSKDVKWKSHLEVVGLIKASGDHLQLTVVTPTDVDYLSTPSTPDLMTLSSTSSTASSTSNSPQYKVRKQDKNKSSPKWLLGHKRSKSHDAKDKHDLNGKIHALHKK